MCVRPPTNVVGPIRILIAVCVNLQLQALACVFPHTDIPIRITENTRYKLVQSDKAEIKILPKTLKNIVFPLSGEKKSRLN